MEITKLVKEGKMKNSHEEYLDCELLRLIEAQLKIERDWLTSINAPVKRLPEYVAIAVMVRVFYSGLSPELARWFLEIAISRKIIEKALEP